MCLFIILFSIYLSATAKKLNTVIIKDSIVNTFKHSGTAGDLIYSLPIVKHFGGGDFYLHLNQINWIGQYYYGSAPAPFHQGRMNNTDYNFMRSFMEAQSYIKKFGILDNSIAITHNLDKFRPLFVGHPGNYVDIYSVAFGINDPAEIQRLRQTPWLTVPAPLKVKDRTVAINRTARWVTPQLSNKWNQWKDSAFFLGLESEYQDFIRLTGWSIPHQKTNSLLELAQYIQGASTFVGNQSMSLSVAIGLGHPDVWCEHRRDLPLERNECYFPNQNGVNYF
jgi:hypothetical protein